MTGKDGTVSGDKRAKGAHLSCEGAGCDSQSCTTGREHSQAPPHVRGHPVLPPSGFLESEGQAESHQQGHLPSQVGLMANITSLVTIQPQRLNELLLCISFKNNLCF